MINKINGINLKNNFNQRIKKNSSATSTINNDFHKVSFGCNPNEINGLYQKIIQKGYTLFKEVDLINPNGLKVKGFTFIKSSPKRDFERNLTSIVTDQDFYQLGEASASTNYNEKGMQKNILTCSLMNFTVPNASSSFERIPEFLARSVKDGKFKNVGRHAYNTLEEYALKNCPEVDTLLAAPITGDSWDFHVKIGFDGAIGEYDNYSYVNYIKKRIRK